MSQCALQKKMYPRGLLTVLYSRAVSRWINRTLEGIAAGLTNYPTSDQFWQKIRTLRHCMWIIGAIYKLK